MTWTFDPFDYSTPPVPAFFSDYTPVDPPFDPASSFWPGGVYGIAANPQLGHSLWSAIEDVTGDGNMVVFNGSPVQDALVWGADISGAAGSEYTFSFWYANVFPASPAVLALSIKDSNNHEVQLPGLFSLADLAQWHRFSVTFEAPAVQFAILLRNENNILAGNDFALDDFQFASVPEPASFAITGAALLALGLMLRRK